MSVFLNQITEGSGGGLLMGSITAFFLIFFVGFTVWAWSPRNRALMTSAARIPLDDGDGQ